MGGLFGGAGTGYTDKTIKIDKKLEFLRTYEALKKKNPNATKIFTIQPQKTQKKASFYDSRYS